LQETRLGTIMNRVLKSEGKPSLSSADATASEIHENFLRALDMLGEERHFVARDLYNDTLSKFQLLSQQSTGNEEVLRIEKLLKEREGEFQEIIVLANEFEQARKNLLDNDGWSYAQTYFGISTHYRNEDDGTLSVKLDGELAGMSLFEIFAVLHEIDLYKTWVPFCKLSEKLKSMRRLGAIGYSVGSIPALFLWRDCAFRAIACDLMNESSSLMISAHSIDSYPGVSFPDPPKRLGADRMIAKRFDALIEVLSPTRARTLVIANVDLKLALPQWLIDFFMKKFAGLLLFTLYKQAEKVSQNTNSQHSHRIRDNPFYAEWLVPKFGKVCRDRGWEMPFVSALQVLKHPPGSYASDTLSATKNSRFLSLKTKRLRRKCKVKTNYVEPLVKDYLPEQLARAEHLMEVRRKRIKYSNLERIPENDSFSTGGSKYLSKVVYWRALLLTFSVFFGPLDEVCHDFVGPLPIFLYILLIIGTSSIAIRMVSTNAFAYLEENDINIVFYEGKSYLSQATTIIAGLYSIFVFMSCFCLLYMRRLLLNAHDFENLRSMGVVSEVIFTAKSILAYSISFFTIFVFFSHIFVVKYFKNIDEENCDNINEENARPVKHFLKHEPIEMDTVSLLTSDL